MSYAYRLVCLLICALVLAALPQRSAEAHAFKTAFGVTVELHIEPDNQPVAGVPIVLQVNFFDDSGKFQLRDCMCDVIVNSTIKNLATFSELKAEPNSPMSYYINYTFPEAGTYQVAVRAQPRSGGNFKPFALVYDITAAPAPVRSSNLWWQAAAGGSGVMVMGFTAWRYARVRRRAARNNNPENIT